MRTLKTISLLIALFFAVPAFAQEDGSKGPKDLSAEEVAKRVQAFYKKTEDFQAKFEQTYQDLAAGTSKKSRGRVYFKKPGMMRWDYYKPNWKEREKLYVSDGDSFWIYETEFKQVFKQCLSNSQLPTSLKFLMGQGNLLDEFDVTFAKESTAAKPALRLVPKKPTSKYKELKFVLDPETFQVRQTVVYDPYGNSNTIDFEKALVNRKLPRSGFEFRAPKGARVINPQKKCD